MEEDEPEWRGDGPQWRKWGLNWTPLPTCRGGRAKYGPKLKGKTKEEREGQRGKGCNQTDGGED